MYNILLTDDEKIVIDSLSLILNKNCNGEVNIFTAQSGIQALEIVRKEKIDIVFMDIHMPKINGLETVNLMKQISPDIVIVVLSAFNQFEYAQEAINLGIYKYLSKPVNRNLIVQTVRDCMNLVDSKRSAVSNDSESQEKQSFVSSIVESDFIYSCIFGSPQADFSAYLEYFGIEDSEYFMCCIEFPALEQEKRYDIYVNVRNILTSRSRCIIGSFMTNRIGIFFPLDARLCENGAEHFQHELMKNFFSLLSTGISAKIKIGVSQIENDMCRASLAYNNALSALNKISGSSSLSGGISFFSDSENAEQEKRAVEKSDAVLTRILNRIKVSDAGSLPQLVSEYIALLFDMYGNEPGRLKNHVMECIFKICSFTVQLVPSYVNSAFDNSFSFLQATDDRNEISQFVTDLCMECVAAVSGVQVEKINPVVQKACAYIEDNLDKDVSLEYLANYCGVSSFYLSKLFKEETGGNFITYVTERRLEKAEKLLHDDSLIIKEITSMVGYNDQNYFSKLFKHKFGISPTEYRETVLKK